MPTTTQFSPPVELAGYNEYINACADGRRLHVIWSDVSDNIIYRRSDDEGQTWTDAADTGADGSVMMTNMICADGEYVHIFYQRSNVLYHRRSTDHGQTWGAENTIYTGSASHYYRASAATLNGKVHIGWCEHDNSTFISAYMRYRRSDDNGANWQAAVVPYATASANHPGRPALAVQGNSVHLCWYDFRDGGVEPDDLQAFTGRSLDSGATWQTEVRLTTGAKNVLRTDIACVDGAVIAVWQQSFSGSELEVACARSTDGGANYGATVRLTTNALLDEHSYISSKGKYVAILWTRGGLPNTNTWCLESHDSGATWDAEKQISTVSGTSAPVVAVSDYYVCAFDNIYDGVLNFLRDPLIGPPDLGTALDNFNRASLTGWTSRGAGIMSGALTIVGSSALTRSSSGAYRQGAYLNTPLAYADAFVAIEVGAINASYDGITIWGRCNDMGAGSVLDGYGVDLANGGEWGLWIVTNESVTSVDTFALDTPAFAVGDLIGLEMNGSRIRMWLKPSGAAWYVVGDVVETTWSAAGYIGMEFAEDTVPQALTITNLWAPEIVAEGPTLDQVLPDADITTTGWSTAPLFSKINDDSDATVITATAS